ELLIAAILGALNLLRSPTGRAFLAIRDSETAARSTGVNLAVYKVMAFSLSAGITGLAGCLYAHKLSFVSPEMFTLLLSLEFIIVIIIGGVGSLHGAVLGSIFVVMVDPFLTLLKDDLPRAIGRLAAGLRASPAGAVGVDGVSFEVRRGEVFTLIGPNGAGKTSIFNVISRFYTPSAGRLAFEDRDITEVPAHEVARLGIARTFQNIELFDNATVLDNLLVGRHRHRTTRSWEELLFLPKVRRAEYSHRRRVEEIIDFLDLQRYRDQLI